MDNVFSSWGEIESATKVVVSLNIAEIVTVALNKRMFALLMEDELLSTAYWLTGLSNDPSVEYRTATTGKDAAVTQTSRQATAYIALCVMMGYVKDITKDNQEAAIKRWKAGLASQNLTDMVDDSIKSEIWAHLLATKVRIYSRSDKRERLLKRFLETSGAQEKYPPTMRAVYGQLLLVYDMAYLKSVVCMQDFINSGNPALILLHVRKEAMEFQGVIKRVQAQEGQHFNLCRLLDNTKYPELNHSRYPDLYAVTLQWARKTKRVQKNYLGSKAITDRSLDIDLARQLISVKGTQKIPDPTVEDVQWLASVGCLTKADDIRKIIQGGKGTKRRRQSTDTDTEDDRSSDSEDEDETPTRKPGRKHKKH